MAKSWFSACSEIITRLHPADGAAEEEEDVQPGQDHIFAFYDQLSDEEKAQLDEQFDDIAVDEVEEAFAYAAEWETMFRQDFHIESPTLMNWGLKRLPDLVPGANLTKVADVGEKKLAMWRTAGFDLYAKGRVALVVMSGGMDSRLGDGVPKGALDLGLLSHKSVFQLYMERVRRIQHMVYRKFRRAVNIPVYIMCNRQNRYIIEDFFRENEFFGIRAQDVMFFTQSYAPVMSKQGKLLLVEKHKIAMYPNGNGGAFRALVQQGMISDMKSRGVTRVFVCSTDNLLCRVGDPVFVGVSEMCKVEAALKCVEKMHPDESFGVYVSRTLTRMYDADGDGVRDTVVKVKASVVEFFEIPDELKRRRSKMTTGIPPLALNAGNLSQYFFKVDFIKKTAPLMSKKWHLIPKAMDHLDPKTGELVQPTDKDRLNARRLEMFIFDAFDHVKSVIGLEVSRDEFALVKNPSGPDSPQTALQIMGKLHQKWIIAAGGEFQDVRISTEREDAKCEISPLVSYAGEDLEGQFPSKIRLPYYLPSQQELLQFSAASSGMTRRPSTHYLDWYSELAQRELEVELQGNLGVVMDMMEDQSKYEYEGERAEQEEVLPPTPREEDATKPAKGKGRGEGGSAAGSALASGVTSGVSTPGTGASPRSAALAAQQKGDRLKDLASGAPPSPGKPLHQRGVTTTETRAGKEPPGAAAAGGSLATPAVEDKKRGAYWGEVPGTDADAKT